MEYFPESQNHALFSSNAATLLKKKRSLTELVGRHVNIFNE